MPQGIHGNHHLFPSTQAQEGWYSGPVLGHSLTAVLGQDSPIPPKGTGERRSHDCTALWGPAPPILSSQVAQSLLTALFFINTLLLVTALSFTAAPCLVSPFRRMNRNNEL